MRRSKKHTCARRAKKNSMKITRRELLNDIAAGTVAIAMASKSKAESCEQDGSNPIAWHRYAFKMSLNVPRIYNNS